MERSFAIIISNKDTFSKNVPHTHKIAKAMLFKLGLNNFSSASINNQFAAPAVSINPTITPSTPAPVVVTPKIVQQMIVWTFSILGLQSNDTKSQFWLVDSAASYHMANSSRVLKNIHKYYGSSEIEIANGSILSITKIGDIN